VGPGNVIPSAGERQKTERLAVGRPVRRPERGVWRCVVASERRVWRTVRKKSNYRLASLKMPLFIGDSRGAGVAVMQTADLGNGGHLAEFRRLHRPRVGRILAERPMGARVVIVVHKRTDQAPKLCFL
jgi:hypothetical protein